jgi:hypothetical protein
VANDRITQIPVEVLVLPDDAKARTTQVPVEALVAPTDAMARVTQVVVEVLIQNIAQRSYSQGFIID